METVLVTGLRTNLDTLPGKILNIPQSIDVLPAEVIKQQGLSDLQAALRNVPGITLNAGEGGGHGDNVNLRGFSASDDIFLDGQRDTGTYFRDTFDLEAVEIYKGPASTLFGRGSTGGEINLVSKSAKLTPIDELTMAVTNGPGVRSTADVNYVIDDTSAVRVNLMGQDSGVVDRDFAENRRFGIAPTISFGIDEPTTFSLSVFHQEEDSIPDYGIPFLFNAPAPVKRSNYYGLVADDRTQTDVTIVTARVDHNFTDAFSISNSARYGYYWFDYRMSVPQFSPPPLAGTPPASIAVWRDRPSQKGTITTWMDQTNATARFSTGPLAHTLVIGLDLDHEAAALTRFANQSTAIAPTPLLTPDPHEAFPGRQTAIRALPTTKADTVSVYAIDSMALGKNWTVEGAVRFDHFVANYNEPISGSQFDHTDDVASPRASLIYKPNEAQTFYFSYGTSYNPSAENLSLSARTADLGPEQDRTYELGAKTQWLDGMLAVTAALFNTEMTNARVGDPYTPNLQILAGVQRVNGAELGVSGNLTEHWEIQGGYTYLDAKTVKSTDATQIGKPLPNTTHNQANIWTVYEFDTGWKLGTGINWLDRRAADTRGQVFIPAYVTWDAMASCRITDTLGLQLNVNNITDETYFLNSYYTSANENHIIPGAGRTFTLTATLDL